MGGWSQGYYSLLISHQVPQDAPNKRAPGLTSGFSLSHGGSSSGWPAFSPVAHLGTLCSEAWLPLFPSSFLELSFVIPVVA